jgi:hypothetical protein
MAQFDQIDFLAKLIEQCPDDTVAELQVNWYRKSLIDQSFRSTNSYSKISECKSETEKEIFKLRSLYPFLFNKNIHGINKLWEGGLNILITFDLKSKLIEEFKKNFDNFDIIECLFYSQSEKIAECYDHFEMSILNQKYFHFNKKDIMEFDKNDIEINMKDYT